MNNFLTILLPLAMVGAAIWFTLRMRKARQPKKLKNDPAARQERAVWAWARVVSSTSGSTAGNWVRVAMELEVHVPGTTACVAKTTWLVERAALEYVETGKEISLKADPQDPQYVFPNAPWARIPE